MSKNRPKPLDIVTKNLVDRLWDDDVCDRKALTIVRSVLGQVAAEAAREAVRKERLTSTRLTPAEREELKSLVALGDRVGGGIFRRDTIRGGDVVVVVNEFGSEILEADNDDENGNARLFDFIAAARNAVAIIARLLGEGT